MKKLLFLMAAMILAVPSLFADSITLHFEGENWDQVWLTNANEYAANYGEYYHPTSKDYVYEFEMPYNPETNTPGLEIGVEVGLKVTVTCDDPSGLSEGPDWENNDYMLNDGSDAGWSPYSRVSPLADEFVPNLSKNVTLSLFSPKMNGRSFTVRISANDELVTFNFLGYGIEETDGIDAGEFLASITFMSMESAMDRVNRDITSNQYVYEFEGPVIAQMATLKDGYRFRVTSDDVEEGPDTYTVEIIPGKYFGTTIKIYLYEGMIKKSLNIEVAAPGYALPTAGSDTPNPLLPALISKPEAGSTIFDWFTGMAVRWGTNRLTMVNPKGFSVTYNGIEDLTGDCVMQIIEYDPDPETSIDDVQLQIENTDIFPFMKEGIYTFRIEAGAVTINVDGKQIPNDVITISYNLVTKEKDPIPAAIVNPSAGTLEALDVVTLTWPGCNVRRVLREFATEPDQYAEEVTMTVNGGASQNVDVTMVGASADDEGLFQEMRLNINSTVSGEYVITIPAGCVMLVNPATTWGSAIVEQPIELHYTVTGDREPVATPSTVKFAFQGSEAALQALVVIDGATEEEINFSGNSLDYTYDVYPSGVEFAVPDNYTVEIVAPEDLTPETDYLIMDNVTAGGFTSAYIDLYEGANGAVFNVVLGTAEEDGIAGIDADTAAPVYYNLQGHRVANPTPGQVVIKVANGKAEKVVIK